MKRELNLYLDQFRPKPQPWSITWLIAALLLTGVVIAVHAAYLLWQNSTTRALLAQEENIRQELQSTIAQLKRLIPDNAAIARFDDAQTRLRARIDARQRYLALLAQSQPAAVQLAPSALIAAIAAAHHDAVWLTELELRCCRGNLRPELSLFGSTQQDRALTAYLNALAQQPLLRGLSFPILAVWLPDAEKNPTRLSFLLTTEKDEAKLKAAQERSRKEKP